MPLKIEHRPGNASRTGGLATIGTVSPEPSARKKCGSCGGKKSAAGVADATAPAVVEKKGPCAPCVLRGAVGAMRAHAKVIELLERSLAEAVATENEKQQGLLRNALLAVNLSTEMLNDLPERLQG